MAVNKQKFGAKHVLKSGNLEAQGTDERITDTSYDRSSGGGGHVRDLPVPLPVR
jgi:hypothetical protein